MVALSASLLYHYTVESPWTVALHSNQIPLNFISSGGCLLCMNCIRVTRKKEKLAIVFLYKKALNVNQGMILVKLEPYFTYIYILVYHLLLHNNRLKSFDP